MKSSLRLFSEIAVIIGLSGIIAFKYSGIHSKDGEISSLNQSSAKRDSRLTIFKPYKVFPGYTLVPEEGTAKVLLLDIFGRTKHVWNVDVDRARLLPNCNLLVVHGSKWGITQPKWNALRPVIREYDWDGKVVWEYKGTEPAHHEAVRLENGNTIFLHRTMVPEAIREKITDAYRRSLKIKTDSFQEVTPDGKTVWHWHAYEHLDINNCGKPGCTRYDDKPLKKKKLSDWTHFNSIGVIPPNKWFRAGDKRFKPGNILTVPRNWWTAIIIDKESGDVVWEYTGDYKGGLGGGHEAHMIREGLPGAGNVLIFDNGSVVHPGESFVLEINPVTKKTVWVLDLGKKLYSKAAGSAQRLPNGNTLVSEDKTGRVLEVTPQKEVVWEFRNSYETNRAKRYPIGYCPRLK
ncbi:MAG: hypothetical protein D6808_06640 [Candidatus Dadabacteria bacterium]|nr:MAG: hypothetical protein D6808_06640 [Candidatus Dadabacteria bacterium]